MALGGSVSALPFVCYSFPQGGEGGGALPASLRPLSLLGPRQARRMGAGGGPRKIRPPGCPRLPSCGLPRAVRHRGNRLLKANHSCLPPHPVHLVALCKASSLTVFQRRASECRRLPPSLPKTRAITSRLQLQGFSSAVTSELTLSLWPDQGKGFFRGKSDF